MDKRVGVIAIVVEAMSSVPELNLILHNFSHIIVGRMGIPYKEREVSVISLIVDGTMDDISSLTGKIGKLAGINVKSAITKQ